MKKLKNLIAQRKILAVVIMILFSFVVLNAVWVTYDFMLLGKYRNITKDDRFPGVNISSRDNQTYSISKKKYLRFSGNLAISNENGNFLIVWPYLSKESKFGFTLTEGNVTYNFTINKNGELINQNDSYDDIAKDVYWKHKEEVIMLIKDYDDWTMASEKKDQTFFNE